MFQRQRWDAAVQTTIIGFEYSEPDNLAYEVATAAVEHLLPTPPEVAEATPSTGTISAASHLQTFQCSANDMCNAESHYNQYGFTVHCTGCVE